jgi:carbonic anhydrase
MLPKETIMCLACITQATASSHSFSPSRRKLATSLVLASTLGLGVGGRSMAAPPPKPANALNPDQALERLMAGNQRYVKGNTELKDFASSRAKLSGGQNPYACLLSCADSRVGPEFCFDEARGDLFVNRIAGNYVTTDILASIEYAIAVLGTPLIMVLGHTACGAVKAAIDADQNETDYPGHIQSITSAIIPAVRKARAAHPDDLLAAATRQNILNNVATLANATPVLRSYVRSKELKVVGGLYHLDTGIVELL